MEVIPEASTSSDLSKSQIAKSKSQTNPNFKYPNSKLSCLVNSNFEFGAYLGFGAWNLKICYKESP